VILFYFISLAAILHYWYVYVRVSHLVTYLLTLYVDVKYRNFNRRYRAVFLRTDDRNAVDNLLQVSARIQHQCVKLVFEFD